MGAASVGQLAPRRMTSTTCGLRPFSPSVQCPRHAFGTNMRREATRAIRKIPASHNIAMGHKRKMAGLGHSLSCCVGPPVPNTVEPGASAVSSGREHPFGAESSPGAGHNGSIGLPLEGRCIVAIASGINFSVSESNRMGAEIAGFCGLLQILNNLLIRACLLARVSAREQCLPQGKHWGRKSWLIIC